MHIAVMNGLCFHRSMKFEVTLPSTGRANDIFANDVSGVIYPILKEPTVQLDQLFLSTKLSLHKRANVFTKWIAVQHY